MLAETTPYVFMREYGFSFVMIYKAILRENIIIKIIKIDITQAIRVLSQGEMPKTDGYLCCSARVKASGFAYPSVPFEVGNGPVRLQFWRGNGVPVRIRSTNSIRVDRIRRKIKGR